MPVASRNIIWSNVGAVDLSLVSPPSLLPGHREEPGNETEVHIQLEIDRERLSPVPRLHIREKDHSGFLGLVCLLLFVCLFVL